MSDIVRMHHKDLSVSKDTADLEYMFSFISTKILNNKNILIINKFKNSQKISYVLHLLFDLFEIRYRFFGESLSSSLIFLDLTSVDYLDFDQSIITKFNFINNINLSSLYDIKEFLILNKQKFILSLDLNSVDNFDLYFKLILSYYFMFSGAVVFVLIYGSIVDIKKFLPYFDCIEINNLELNNKYYNEFIFFKPSIEQDFSDKLNTNFLTDREIIFLEKIKETKTVSRDEAKLILWETKDISEDALDQFISRLRKKIKKLGFPYKINTIKNRGFQLISN